MDPMIVWTQSAAHSTQHAALAMSWLIKGTRPSQQCTVDSNITHSSMELGSLTVSASNLQSSDSSGTSGYMHVYMQLFIVMIMFAIVLCYWDKTRSNWFFLTSRLCGITELKVYHHEIEFVYADSEHSCVPNVYIAKSHINNLQLNWDKHLTNHWIYWKNEDCTCICKRCNKSSVLCFVFSQMFLVVLSLHQKGIGKLSTTW